LREANASAHHLIDRSQVLLRQVDTLLARRL
jgi:hypothetical protein